MTTMTHEHALAGMLSWGRWRIYFYLAVAITSTCLHRRLHWPWTCQLTHSALRSPLQGMLLPGSPACLSSDESSPLEFKISSCSKVITSPCQSTHESYSYSSLTCVNMGYSKTLFSSFLVPQLSDHFYAAIQIFVCHQNLQRNWDHQSKWLHTGNLVKCIVLDWFIRIPFNTLMALILRRRSNPNGFSSSTKTSTVAESKLHAPKLILLILQH